MRLDYPRRFLFEIQKLKKMSTSNCTNRLLNFDKFGQSFGIRIKDGKDVKPSKVGAICSLLLSVVLLAYTAYKIQILESKSRVDVLSSIVEDKFDGTDTFGADQGLNIAFNIANIKDGH